MTAKDYSTYRLKPCLVLHRGYNVLCFLVFQEGVIQCVAADVFRPVGTAMEPAEALSYLMPVNQAAIRYMRQLLQLPKNAYAHNPYLYEEGATDAQTASPVSIAVEA